MKPRLIVTADDYGMCDAVNEAIDACLDSGMVRATCVMMNMPKCSEAESLRQKFPHASVGIHWTLTQGRPVLQPSAIPTLVDTHGNFHSAQELRRRWLRRGVNGAEIKNELTAQFHKFTNIAGLPDFWNTHENVHVFPGLFTLFVALGRELQIAAMRSHRRITVPRSGSAAIHNITHPMYWLKGMVIAHWSNRARSLGVQMPDGRLYTPGYNGKGAAAILEAIRRVDWGKIDEAVEVVVHPATHVDSILFGGLTESRVAEYGILTAPNLLNQFRQEGVDLVGFESLSRN